MGERVLSVGILRDSRRCRGQNQKFTCGNDRNGNKFALNPDFSPSINDYFPLIWFM